MCGQDGTDTVANLDPGQLHTTPQLGVVKDRMFVRFSRLANEIVISPFNHNFRNLKRAVTERVFLVKEEGRFVSPPRPKHFVEGLGKVPSILRSLLPSTTPWTHAQFVASCKGRKKERYQKAYDSLYERGPVVDSDAKVEVFIKYEKTDVTSKADPVPRVISPRSFRFNLELGRYLKKLEPKIFKRLGRLFGTPTVIKGYNAYKSASLLKQKWDMFRDPVAVGLDASRFDQHVSVDALKYEHSVYLDCFPIRKHKEKLAKLLKMQLRNECVGYAPDGVLRYTVEGTRMSGDINTSLGNCILMCTMIRAYLLEKGIDAQLANNGDDCVVFMDRSDLETFSSGCFDWFYGMGFNMKIEAPVYEFEHVEFCQTKPIFDGNRWIMVRSPKAVLSKDTTMLMPYQSVKQLKNWMYAVGQGGLRMTGGLPLMQNLYHLYVRNGKPGTIVKDYMSWYARHLSEGMDRDFSPVSAEARDSFHTAFGITPDEQEEYEGYFDNMTISFQVGGEGDYLPNTLPFG